jgi:hypothetical protein
MIDYLTATLADKKPPRDQASAPIPAAPAAVIDGAKPNGQPAMGTPAPAPSPPAAQPPSVSPAPIDVKPPHLVIEPWEQAFMREFFEVIPTPRAIKRFVNVYRLVKARVPEGRAAAFRGDATQGEYRAAMFLLAILTGYPSQATDLMRDLVEEAPTGPWWDWLERALDAQTAEEAAASAQHVRARELRARLKTLRERFEAAKLEPPTCDVFCFWTPYVARFSFQAGRLGATPTLGKLAPADKPPKPPRARKAVGTKPAPSAS